VLIALSIALAGGAALTAAGGLPSRFQPAAVPVVVSPQVTEKEPTSTAAPTSTQSLPVKQESVLLVDIGIEGEPDSGSKPEPKEPEGPESKQSQSSDVQIPGPSATWVPKSTTSQEKTASKGTVYTWHDGDREMRAVLQNDVPMSNGDEDIAASDSATANSASGFFKSEGGGSRDVQPVFRSESGGGDMTLPGGVILLLDGTWDEAEVDRFLVKNQISSSQLTEMEFLENAYLIETAAGFPSLELANSLAGQDGVVSSSPNWQQEMVGK
jgi:hypothetical protein